MKKWLPGSEDDLDAKLEVSDSDSEEAAAALSPVAPEADIRAVYALAEALGLDAPVGDSQQPGPQAPTPPSLGVAAPPGYACEEHADGEPTATPSGEASTQPLVPPAPVTQPVTPDGPVARTGLRRAVQDDTFNWGLFRVTWIKPSSNCPHGAWQGRCPFHRTTTTLCTKRVNLGRTVNKDMARAMVKHWCLQAVLHNRKRHHGAWDPRKHETAMEEVMDEEVRRLPEPPEVLQTDEYLDGEEARSSQPQPAASASANSGAVSPDSSSKSGSNSNSSSSSGSDSSSSSSDSDSDSD